jgi:hypothetical protein
MFVKEGVKLETFGTFHFVSGLDVSNLKSIYNYLDSFIQKIEVNDNVINIISGTLCCYDIYTKTDVHFKLEAGKNTLEI